MKFIYLGSSIHKRELFLENLSHLKKIYRTATTLVVIHKTQYYNERENYKFFPLKKKKKSK